MRMTIVFVFALVAPQVALACNPPVLSASGDALTYESPLTDVYANGGVAAIVDDYIPGSTLLIDAKARSSLNVDLFDSSLAELQVLVGAERIIYEGPPECKPAELRSPEEIFPDVDPIPGLVPPELFPDGVPANTAGAPIALFPDEGAPFQPRDGLWQATIGATEMVGCPAMMQQAFPVSAGALPGMQGDPQRMRFSVPFHPDSLQMSQDLQLR